MEESRLKVQKTAKVLYTISKIIRIILIISSVAVTALCITSMFVDNAELIEQTKEMVSFDWSIKIVEDGELNNIFSERVLIVLGTIVYIISRAVLFVYLTILGNIFADISKGGQPFTNKNSKTIFVLSLTMLVFAFVNPLLAITLLLIGLFLSHLFSYGAYLNKKAEETNHIQESMIVSFAEVVENKSEQTGKHVKRVAEYSKVLAKAMGYSEEDAEKIKLASMMHDIGKLLVPTDILEKPARLTEEEFMEIKKHPGYGVKLLSDVDGDVLILAKRIAHEHHERFDGRGYPDGLGATNISMEGRIVAVADVYDALTSKRSYKDAWEPKQAYEEIVKGSGSQFDEDVVKAFCGNYEEIENIRCTFKD